MSYQGVYIFDLVTKKTVFISNYTLLRCDLSDSELNNLALNGYGTKMSEQDRALLEDVFKTAKSVLGVLPVDNKKNCVGYLYFHIQAEGRTSMVCHKIRLVDFDTAGSPRLLLGMVSPSVRRSDTGFTAFIRGKDFSYLFDNETKVWNLFDEPRLTNDECDMLRCTMQGYTLEEIGKIMNKSVETIKFYRRQVFAKMSVRNISEAISVAVHYGFL